MVYRLERTQQLNCNLDEAWSFFSSPYNLGKITPPEMRFVVHTALQDSDFKEGLIIDYTVRPLFGIPMNWKTKIAHVDFHKSFTDFQEKGPYRLWNHFHEFEENDQGVLMKDTVDYKLPFGYLGRIVHFLLVRKKIERIFDYRYQMLEKKYATKEL